MIIDDDMGRIGECRQCWDARMGRQRTNGPCRCVRMCGRCLRLGQIANVQTGETEPCPRCVGNTRPGDTMTAPIQTQAQLDQFALGLLSAGERVLRLTPVEPIDVSRLLWVPIPLAEIPGSAINDGCSDGAKRSPIACVEVQGETGPDARPLNPEWVRQIRDACQAAGVRFVFGGWGEWGIGSERGCPGVLVGSDGTLCPTGSDGALCTRSDRDHLHTFMCRVGPERSGRLLDGREWH